MVFTTYLDESGTHQASQDIVLAGYVATIEQWAVFDNEWKNAIAEFGLPYFHMSEFTRRIPPYDTWTAQQREARFARLVGIINTNITCSVGVILPRLEYAAAMGKTFKAIPGRGYGYAAVYLTTLVPFELRRNHHQQPQIAYVLDRGAPRGGEIIKCVDTAAQDRGMANRLGFLSIKSEDKQRFVPLQAADILAYQLYRFGKHYHSTARFIPYPKHLKMLKTKAAYWVRLNESQIRVLNAKSRFISLDLLMSGDLSSRGDK